MTRGDRFIFPRLMSRWCTMLESMEWWSGEGWAFIVARRGLPEDVGSSMNGRIPQATIKALC